MIDALSEWIPQRGYQRQRNIGPNRFGVQNGLPQAGSLLGQENVSLMLLNSLAFGEDEHVNELIQQEVLPEMLCNELVEYPFPMPPDDDIWGPINFGSCEVTGAPAGIFPHELHTLIVGASGKGKSTLNKHLIIQHLDAGIPVLIPDFENEYAELLGDDRIAVLGMDDLKWNPLEVPPGMDPVFYRQTFCSIFADTCGLLIASKSYLDDAIDRLYTLYGVYNGSDNFPSMYDLADLLKEMLKRSRATSRFTTYGEVCLNRAQGFALAFPNVLDCSRGMPLQLLTRGNVIIELNGVDHEYQSLFVTLMLSWLCCHRIANDLRNNPEHDLAVFIDEAQRLFDAQLERRPYQGIPTISHLVATVRKYNLKLFVAAQQPSLLASSIKANSFCKVELALGSGGDMLDMGSSMYLTPEQTYFSRKLEVGQAIVKFSGRWPEPFIIRIPHEE